MNINEVVMEKFDEFTVPVRIGHIGKILPNIIQ